MKTRTCNSTVLLLKVSVLISFAFLSCKSATKKTGIWELMILDANTEFTSTGCLGAADIDGDGRQEMLVGGAGALVWYRPETFEKGLVANGNFHVGMILEDVDGCGRPEVFVGEQDPQKANTWMITWYKPGKDLHQAWERHIIDPAFDGGPHDILFADLDGDGEKELVAIACYTPTPGIFAFTRGDDIQAPWEKHAIQEGLFTEGLSIGDLNGDGKPEIVCGPDWYTQPAGGALSGHWDRKTFAPNFREMCRTALVDISGNGRPDILITDSEYMDGYLSWFENRITENPENPWVEHRLEDGLIYAHSLDVRRDPRTKETLLFVAEMEQGGWNAPYNLDARLITYVTGDHGKTWDREVLYKGEGTHQAILHDIDNDGELEVIGKTCSQEVKNPKVQIWDHKDRPSLNVTFRHRFLDRDKPNTAIEIMAADVDRDGKPDVLCGDFWYKNPNWERYDIPGIYQVMNSYDLDKDGEVEFIAMKRNPQAAAQDDYAGLLSGEIWWIKPLDPENGKWQEYLIGKINGDWVHGSTIAPLLPGDKPALITCYHNSQEEGKRPELFEIPDDPRITPWPKRNFTDVLYNEELIPHDIDQDGMLDIAAGQYWFNNLGNGSFRTYRTDENIDAARIGLSDINRDGRTDMIIGQQVADWNNRHVPYSPFIWLENPEDATQVPWEKHVIDVLRYPHSLGVADIDQDGENEIIAGEHDPFWPYRKRCRLMAYKKANAEGTAWYCYLIDGRFEHHDGAKIFEMEPGQYGIISHGWKDKKYVHLWEVVRN